MKRTALSVTVILCASLLALGLVRPDSQGGGLVPPVQAQDDPFEHARARYCSLGTVRGSFGLTAQGTFVALPAGFPLPAGPYTVVGLVTFDGNGQLTLRSTQSFNGVIVPPSNFTGTYTVNADCTGTAALDAGGTFSLVIVDGGNEILFQQTNPGSAVTGIAKRP